LDAVVLVTFPSSLGGDPFSGNDRGKAAQHGNGLLAPQDLHLQDAKSVLLVMKGHALDLPAQRVVGSSGHRLIVRLLSERSARGHGLSCHGIEYTPILRPMKIADGVEGGAGDDGGSFHGISISAATYSEAFPRGYGEGNLQRDTPAFRGRGNVHGGDFLREKILQRS
jgi:hypothetical protein